MRPPPPPSTFERLDSASKRISELERELSAAKSALVKAKQTLDSAQRSMPAYHEGGFYFERHDIDGNYIGSENVDPISVVQGLDQAVSDAITALTAALEDTK